MKDIGIRLREYRILSNTKMPIIASATGIAKETLYKWEKGTKPSSIEEYYKLKGYLDKMESNLDEETFELVKQHPATLRIPLTSAGPAVPQSDGIAASGTVIFSNNEPELIVDRINAPCLGTVDGSIEIIGNSMEPTFCNGGRIAISRLSDNRSLIPGQYYYIIDTNWQGIVRRVYPGERGNSILLVADNPDQLKHPPIEKSLDQVAAIFKVGAALIKF
ncbi:MULTISPECIES: helix-turn-helix transcriptional regulator [Niastella]|uniref:Helix-turn-helix transcriptional regulator n=1 Tax=Niastella soli TaxID=2821487 RepID=A0ABS3YQR2_9BACT|nr:helix-turn-helix transcriptional regulator [Niastella soli]MBO9200228.1 helix-turn-helix transcriptional regulator [Niastella soli]